MKILTVTIPSYNAEKYLDKGIPTMLEQSILDDIEIIIVDDGSTDRTAEIADGYCRKYPDTIKVIHKENGGHGSTINSSIQVASGKYFCVIDADDWVDTINFVKLVNVMKTSSADLILANAARVDADDNIVGYEKIGKMPPLKEVQMDKYIGKIRNIEMHNYFILSEILRENNIQCHEHYFYEDQEFVLYSLVHVKTALFINMVVYRYLWGRDGQSISMESKRKNYNHITSISDFLITFYKKNRDFMTSNQIKHYVRKIAWFQLAVYSVLLGYYNNDKKEEMKRYDRELKKKSTEIYNANEDLCIFLMRMTNFSYYGMMAFIYKIVKMR